MKPPLQLLYDTAALAANGAAWLAPSTGHKALRALRARRGIISRYRDWGSTGRDLRRTLLWMHAPSVGEGLQARPLLALARERRPDLQLAYTHFSPSAESFTRSLDVDFRDYLPFDSPGNARRVLSALQPRALVFSKLDVWPNLVRECSRRRVRLGLVSATLAHRSRRRGMIANRLLRGAYGRLDAVGAIDAEDAVRLTELGVRADVVVVTGDTRYDQVWERATRARRDESLLQPLQSSRPTLVAGSTWPADERPLLAAWQTVRRRIPGARLIIAPHEPTAEHLEPIESWSRSRKLALARLGDAGADHDVVLVDRLGVLGMLYALADVAFVGGGFHDAGLHSVLEPAAFGVPVLFGPRYGNSRDARLLIDRGGRSADGPAALADALLHWLGDERARATEGDAARELVRAGLGAAERSWALVSGLLPPA